MITAIDTHILLDVLIPNESFFEASADALENSSRAGALVICDIVYAELSIHFDTQDNCNDFLGKNGIHVQGLTAEALFAASRAWRSYRLHGGKRSRILPDFLIGAHAQRQATRLLSRDRGFYRELFPSLAILDPSE